MSPEEINSAIAEAAFGWKPSGRPSGIMIMPGGQGDYAPDFTGDLNACFQMEETLTHSEFEADERGKFMHILEDIIRTKQPIGMGVSWFDLTHSTPAQRCEAFLRAKNLWVEENK